jgi:hypothetical protein
LAPHRSLDRKRWKGHGLSGYFAREIVLRVTDFYALPMAGVFIISLGTIWRRALVPRQLGTVSFVAALYFCWSSV